MASGDLTNLRPGTNYGAAVAALGDGRLFADSNFSPVVKFKTEGPPPIEEDEMADTFGVVTSGRVQQDGRFYAIPASSLDANTVYMPAYSTSPFFGINEVPIAANALGAFATTGIFAFDFPESWNSVAGQAVYYKPTSASTGTISASKSSGAVRLGYEVIQPNITGKLCVYIAPGDSLES